MSAGPPHSRRRRRPCDETPLLALALAICCSCGSNEEVGSGGARTPLAPPAPRAPAPTTQQHAAGSAPPPTTVPAARAPVARAPTATAAGAPTTRGAGARAPAAAARTLFSARIAAGRAWLHGPTGRRLLDLLPVARVVHRGWPARTVRFTDARIVRARGGWTLRAVARTRTLQLQLEARASHREPRIALRVVRRYLRPVLVAAESLRWRSAALDSVRLLDRAYHLRALSRRQLIDPLTPQQVQLAAGVAQVTWLGGAGAQALRARPLAGARAELVVELDHRRNHPQRPRYRCPGSPSSRRFVDHRRRTVGEQVELRGQWVVAAADQRWRPARLARFPDGFASALVLTDHADQSDADRLEAFAFGATGALARGEVGEAFPGFVNRGLSYTKTVFAAHSRGYAPQLDQSRYRRVLQEMARRGVEVGLHSPTGASDDRRRCRALLQRFRRAFDGATWIDHQPTSNCEALYNSGWDPRSRWYVLDLLAQHGLRYLWAVPDLRVPRRSLNLFEPRRGAYRPTLLFAAPRALAGQYFFRTTMLFTSRRRLLSWLSRRRLDALAAEHGLLIGHVYLDSYRRRGRFAPRALLRRRGGGGLQLRADVDRVFRRLAARQRRGALWVTSLVLLADHLLAVREATLSCGGRGELWLELPRPLTGVTLQLPAAPARCTLRVAGKRLALRQRAGAAPFVVLPRLPSGRRLRLSLRDARGASVPLCPTGVAIRAGGAGGPR